jgi:hypothetical protein
MICAGQGTGDSDQRTRHRHVTYVRILYIYVLHEVSIKEVADEGSYTLWCECDLGASQPAIGKACQHPDMI